MGTKKPSKYQSALEARLGEALKREVQLQAELNKLRWIPMAERLPTLGESHQSKWVWVTDGKRVVDAYYYDMTHRKPAENLVSDKGWHCHGIKKSEITHWKPIILPEGD